MSLTIMEVLENADSNLQRARMPIQIEMAKSQLHNALDLINQGFKLEDDFDRSKLTNQ